MKILLQLLPGFTPSRQYFLTCGVFNQPAFILQNHPGNPIRQPRYVQPNANAGDHLPQTLSNQTAHFISTALQQHCGVSNFDLPAHYRGLGTPNTSTDSSYTTQIVT